MRQQKYYNNKNVLNPVVRNRRDADKLISVRDLHDTIKEETGIDVRT